MNHFNLSLYKSAIRICGSIAALVLVFTNVIGAIVTLAASYGLAEILGILEEIFDKRKEK